MPEGGDFLLWWLSNSCVIFEWLGFKTRTDQRFHGLMLPYWGAGVRISSFTDSWVPSCKEHFWLLFEKVKRYIELWGLLCVFYFWAVVPLHRAGWLLLFNHIFPGASHKDTLDKVLIDSLKFLVFVLPKNLIDFDNLLQFYKILLAIKKFNGIIGMMIRVWRRGSRLNHIFPLKL